MINPGKLLGSTDATLQAVVGGYIVGLVSYDAHNRATWGYSLATCLTTALQRIRQHVEALEQSPASSEAEALRPGDGA